MSVVIHIVKKNTLITAGCALAKGCLESSYKMANLEQQTSAIVCDYLKLCCGQAENNMPVSEMDSVCEATNMNLTQLREGVEDRRAWRALVHGVTKSRTRLND